MPTNDTLNAHTTPVLASIDGGVTPYATFANPFPNGLVLPAGQNISLAQSVILGQTTRLAFDQQPMGLCSAIQCGYPAGVGLWVHARHGFRRE